MALPQALASGLAAAAAVTVMHECARKTLPHPPRLDLLGMKGIAKVARALNSEPPEHLRTAALGADIAANTAYYALAGAAGPRHAVALGAALGAAAGLGSLLLPGPLGLGSAETNRTRQSQFMALGIYFAGGLIAGGLYAKARH